MVKVSQLALLLTLGCSHAFTIPAGTQCTFARTASQLRMAFQTGGPTPPSSSPSEPIVAQPAAPVTPTEPVTPAEPEKPKDPAGKLVPIKEETVEFTAGIVGGVAGFVIGGPFLAAIAASLANYASKTQENEFGEVVNAVSKSSIEVYNYLAKLDTKYEVLDNAKKSLENALEKLKANSGDPATIEKVEKALDNTSTKIKEINEEYDLVGASVTAFGVVGDLVERSIKKAGEINEEYKLTDRAMESIRNALKQAKDSSK